MANRKIKLSALSEELRKQVKLQINEGSTKLSQMPSELKKAIISEMDGAVPIPMMNSEEVYFNAGQQTAKAMRRKRGGVNQTQWFNKAIALEQGENKDKAELAYNRGYKSELEIQPQYFRESTINKKVLNETGEWDESDEYLVAWKQDLENDVRNIEHSTDGKVQFVSVHGFDAYQGPYAIAKINGKTYKVWTNDGMLWIDGFPVDNTSEEGKNPGYQGTVDDIIEMLNLKNGSMEHGYSLNEVGPGDEEYIVSNFGPLLDDEDQYGYHLQVRSTNKNTKWMSLNKNQLLGIIEAIKRG